MAKNQYIPGLLFSTLIFLCAYTNSNVLIDKPIRFDDKQVLPFNNRYLSLRDEVQRSYLGEIGIREQSGANDGTRVEEYLSYTRLGKGNPWCASFVCWVLGNAGVNNPRSAWSPDLFPVSKVIWDRGKLIRSPSPRYGDVFAIYFPDKKRIAHCGFIDEWNAAWAITVEGNTSESNSRDGDGVYRKRRMTRSLYKVADWIGGEK